MLRLRSNLSLALGRWALREHDEKGPEDVWRPRAERAIEVMQFTLGIWRERGKWGEISSAMDNLAIAYIVLGKLDEAHAALDEAELLLDPEEVNYSMVSFSCVRARAHLQAGDPARALEAIERGRASSDIRGGHVHIDEIHRLKSLAHERAASCARRSTRTSASTNCARASCSNAPSSRRARSPSR